MAFPLDSSMAVQAAQNLAGLTNALRNLDPGLSLIALEEIALPGTPVFAAYERLLASDKSDVTPRDIASVLAATVIDLEQVIPGHEALERVKQNLSDLQSGRKGEPRRFQVPPSFFQPSALEIARRYGDAVSHQTLNPIGIADLELQILEAAGLPAETLESVRRARQALKRASTFVQGLADFMNGTSPNPENVMARVEQLFDWKMEEGSDGAEAPAAPPASSRRPIEPGDARIVFVDDEPDLRDLMIEALDGYGFSHIQCMDNAQAALAVFDGKDPIDLVLSDYRMPGMSGLEMARKARTQQKRCDLPFIFVTGSPNEVADQIKPEEKDDFKVVSKPLDLDRLVNMMNEILQRHVH